LAIPGLWYAGRPIHFGVGPMVGAIWRFVVASLIAGCATYAAIRSMSSLVLAAGISGAMTRVVAISLLCSVLYLGAVVLLHGGLDPLSRFGRLLPDMLPWTHSAKPLPPSEPVVD